MHIAQLKIMNIVQKWLDVGKNYVQLKYENENVSFIDNKYIKLVTVD